MLSEKKLKLYFGKACELELPKIRELQTRLSKFETEIHSEKFYSDSTYMGVDGGAGGIRTLDTVLNRITD